MSYAVGDRVRVSPRRHDGHHRTPAYVKGRTGVVERVHARFTNPETRAYGIDDSARVRLYLVGFEQGALWGGYLGASWDRLYVDLFEHWLEPAA
jgi:hypothetical protein